MKITRILAVTGITAALALALTGCFGNLLGGGGTSNGGGNGSVADLTGTSWSGVDSAGDATTFDFASDGTVGVTYNENSYDDPGDTWSQDGAQVTVNVFINSDVGTAVYTGSIDGDTLDMAAVTDNGQGWTVTLTQD